jgi:hypothetical protein
VTNVPSPDRLWRPAAALPAEPLTALDGAAVGEHVTLECLLGPRNQVGARYFRLHLASPLGRSQEPAVFGLQNSGPYPGYNWVEVIAYTALLAIEDGDGATRTVEVPPGIERRIFAALAALVPPGGHLMAEYDSPAREVTARALAARVPPLATPLGALLHAAGCGDAFRDWYISEGGREGPRKLQGFRALDLDHARRRGREQLAALDAFLASAADLDWNLQAQCRPLAQAAVEELRARFAA